jgi:hypothetical protein
MSRTIKFAKAGGPEVLEFVEVQVPAPGPHLVAQLNPIFDKSIN